MKKLGRNEMRNLKGGLLPPPSDGCLARPASGTTSCSCLAGDPDGWCQTYGNGSSCYCLSTGSPACYTNGMSVCSGGS